MSTHSFERGSTACHSPRGHRASRGNCARRDGKGRGQGHKQMLGQAAAMLVSLPAVLAMNFRSVELSPLFGEWLTITASAKRYLV